MRPGSSPSASAAAAGAARGPQRPQKPYHGGPHVGGRGRSLPASHGGAGPPDLKRIGMKYGGQISITSSDGSGPSTSAGPGPSTSSESEWIDQFFFGITNE